MNENLSAQGLLDSLAESKLLSADEFGRAVDLSTRVSAACFEESLVASGVLTLFQVETVRSRNFEVLRIGNYEVLDRLGAGGMGTVFKARHRLMKRIVALKLLSSGMAKDEKFVRRFQREVEVISRLSHPNIVMAYDADEDTAGPFLIMECVDGDDLAALVKENGPFDVPVAIDCILQAARGMDYAHSQGIIHRDIKPANLLRDATGVVKVSDLGVARLNIMDGGADVSGITQAGGIVGSAYYMSPEQAIDSTTIDHRADIYSLGATLYFLLLGRPPYQADTIMAVFLQHRDAPIPSLADDRKDVPPALDAVFSRMLAKAPADRCQTMAEVVLALEAVESGEAGKTGVTLIRPVVELEAEPSSSGEKPKTSVESTPSQSREKSAEKDSSKDSSSAGTRQAERRQITILVCGCELFESEAYLDDLDAEDQAEVLQALRETCEPTINLFGGTIVRLSERGLLACFGYPVAYEDAANRAAKAGLNLLQEMKVLDAQLSGDHKLALCPWVAIHTGQAVAETHDGAVSLVGDARNVAVRLEDVSRTGQVVCSEATHRLIAGHFECASMGPHKIKGAGQPVEIFHVQSVVKGRSLIDTTAEATGLTPLTGRDNEISLLKDRWEQAQEGMGQVVLLIGEPGLGKSRLVHTLKEHVLQQMVEGEVDAPVIEWRCSPHFQNTGLYPAIDFYERALAFGREETPQARFDRLVYRLEQYGLARPETVPLWASLLSLPTTDRFAPLSLSPTRQREETFRAMLEWLHTRASRNPILFVVEDLHWVDASTLEFLGQFLAEGLHDRCLTLLTFRPEFETPWPAVAHQTSLALNRLTKRQVVELINKKASGKLPEDLVGQIYERAGGVPLFVEEFTKMVLEAGMPDRLTEGDKRTKNALVREIPNTLQDLVMARLDRMEGGRELAQLAAVLGREFSYDLLAAVAAVDETALEAELSKLVAAEILYPKGQPPRRTYIFKHALLEDALYNTLVKAKRQQYHRRIAEVLEAQFPQTAETQPEVVAHHFTEGGIAERAIGYWLKAGLRGLERSANAEAIGHLTKGLSIVRASAESPERDAQELQFLTPLGTTYMAVRGYAAPEVGPVFQRARELADRIGQPAQRFVVMWGNWAWNLDVGRFRLSMELAVEAIQFVETLNDPGMMMEALFMPGLTMVYRGDFAGARDHLERAVADYDDRERTKFWTAHTGQDSGVTERCYLALSLWHLGYPDQALQLGRETIELARTIGHPFSLGFALHHAAWLRQHCRLVEQAQEVADEESKIATEQGFAFWHAMGTFDRGAGSVLQGNLEVGLALLVEGLAYYRATGAELALPYYLSHLGDGYTRAGRFEDAHRTIGEALAIAEKNDDRFQEAELHRLLGELHLVETNDEAAAEECFNTAIATARRQQSRAWELRATTSLARLWRRQGRRDEARRALGAVYGTYTEGFTTPDLVDAKGLLDQLG